MQNNAQKILWREGTFLEPHHFQFSDRLHTAKINSRVGSLAYAGFQYGFTELEIDRDALLVGNFTLSRAAGVLPDGACFSIYPNTLSSSGASAGVSRSFSAFCRPDRQALDVYLALPVYAPAGAGVQGVDGAGGHSDCRYVERALSIPDELSADNIKEIDVGEPNYQIRFEGESLDGCVWLRVARLSRGGSGYMELAHDYAPPVLFTRAAGVLRDALGGLLELLWARIGSLAKCRRRSEWGQAFFSATEENSFRVMSALCTFTPLLGRLLELPKIHPFECYAHLMMLYGSLQCFSPALSPENFPAYNHEDPAATFTELADRIRDALKAEFWTTCVSLTLEQISAATWHCRFPDAQFASRANLFIGVSADVDRKKLLVDVLQRVKAGSRENLDLLISSSLQGLPLIHVRNIPEGLPAKPEYVYFAVDRHGPLWESVENTGTLGLHFSGGVYPDMKLEVLGLKFQ
ncbi:MAG: type VI secretion system baseplate subunit TssK [Chitinispirillales bacterium]|jgi:type VI secretion system protein ImpJ|nr:type VI secretion system baseplate subunit TssK [Chitinispirillales bacterium]